MRVLVKVMRGLLLRRYDGMIAVVVVVMMAGRHVGMQVHHPSG